MSYQRRRRRRRACYELVTYDDAGRLTRSTQPGGLATAYTCDTTGRRVAMNSGRDLE
ncbi:RHS repeat domain-containing protein [Dactylosporangium sp. NPDC049140]|uniref:RHS repeat domain-containing protein n=1 Tax=Dactylosporangium sp. NPDC049140 TaxID=3155647 RepID=UPI0033E2A81D